MQKKRKKKKDHCIIIECYTIKKEMVKGGAMKY